VYVKRFSSSRVSSAGAPNTIKYNGLYIWTTFNRTNGKTSEIDGKRYDPHVNKTCAV
jgi:hypothetical protein